jgi:ribosomal protein L11 methyltransferase
VIRLAIRVRGADAEAVLAELLELVPAGLEERELEDGTVEYAIYGAPGELPTLPDLRASVGEALVEVATSELPDDWSERWKQFHRPVLVQPPSPVAREGSPDDSAPVAREGRGEDGSPVAREGRAEDGGLVAREGGVPALHVRAPWLAAAEGPGTLEIVIDPGQAFGTGAHASTRLCLELLLALAATSGARGPALDVGCGSGVLAIAASLLGYAPVSALDVEQASVLATRENAERNGASVEVRRSDLRRGVAVWREAPVVLANLVRPLLLELASELPAAPAHLIAGGLLVDQVDEIVEVFEARFTLQERERRLSPEWAAVWLSAPAQPG